MSGMLPESWIGWLLSASAALVVLGVGAFAFWRYYWFYRNPMRTIPPGRSLVCPADGTVVYVKRVEPNEPVISIKQGVAASVNDIVKEELAATKLLIGIFMSPFSVHYNRAPLDGVVESIHHHPARGRNLHMGAMHWRTVFGRQPMYEKSEHIVANERLVTRLRTRVKDRDASCYIVQIGGGSIHGIDSFKRIGETVKRGEVFGMIRIGSQVDLVIPADLVDRVLVQPGDKVRAGETILVE
jgi:phosphatidylserine decarboxylase